MPENTPSPLAHHSNVRIKVNETLLRDIIAADTFLEVEEKDEKGTRVYEHNCNRRELKLYNLLRSVVHDFNKNLTSTRIKLRLVEEGSGLYIEMDI